MPFPVKCSNCGTQLKAQEKHIGKKLACPKCKSAIVVAAPQPEAPVEDPLAVSDLGNLDLGDLGQSDPLATPVGANFPNYSAYLQPPRPAAATAKPEPAKSKLSGKTIGLIAAGSVGGLLLLTLVIFLGMWAFGGGEDSAQPETAQASPAPTTGAASTPAVGTPTSGSAPTNSAAQPPAKPNWQAFVEEQDAAGIVCFASLSVSEGAAPQVLLASTEKNKDKKFSLGPPRTDLFPNATGIPLIKRPAAWFTGEPCLRVIIWETKKEEVVPVFRWNIEKPKDADLIHSAVDGDGYTLRKLKADVSPSSARLKELEEQSAPFLRSDHRHLWSPDGTSLYVLAATEQMSSRDDGWKNCLLKINPQNWTIENRVIVQRATRRNQGFDWRTGTRISDLAWSSEGLVAVVKESGDRSLYLDANNVIWFPVSDPERPFASLVLIDPTTLAIKQAWAIPSLPEIAGSPNGPLVYLQNRGQFMCVVDVKKGEVVNLVQRNSAMQKPLVTNDGKWLLSHGEQSVNRFRLEGTGMVFDQDRLNIGKRGVILSSDEQFVSFRGRDKYYAARTDDLNKSLGTTSGDEIGQMALDSANKTVYVCSASPTSGKLMLQVNRETKPLMLELDPIPSYSKPKEESPNFVRRPTSNEPHAEMWPIAMSADPSGRGLIIFTKEGAYWFESMNPSSNVAKPPTVADTSAIADAKGQGELTNNGWVFDPQDATKVSAVKALQEANPDLSHLKLPDANVHSIELQKVKDPAPGTAYQFPKGHHYRKLDVDPKSGDLAVFTIGGTAEANGSWISVFESAGFKDDVVKAKAVLLLPRNDFLGLRFKQIGSKTYLILVRDEVVFLLDPHTLQLADVEGGVQNQIDLGARKYDNVLRPWASDPTLDTQRLASLREKMDRTLTVYTSADANDQTIVLGRGEPDKDGSQQGFQLSLATGELKTSPKMPSPGFSSVMSPYLDPYGALKISTQGITRDGITAAWKEPRSVSILPLGVLSKIPWVVLRGQTNLYFYNRDDLSDKTELAFPSLMQMEATTTGVLPTALFDDGPRNRLLLAGNPSLSLHGSLGTLIWFLPITEAKLPKRPLLVVQLQMPDSVQPGAPVSVPFAVPDSDTKVTLVKGPDGAKLKGNKLEWNPTLADVGFHEIVLQAANGQYRVEQKFPCTVQFSSAALPHPEVGGLDLSSSGERALVWHNWIQLTHNKYDDPHISLVNVRDRSVVVTRRLKHQVRQARLFGDRAFLLLGDGFTLQVCQAENLEPIETLRLTQEIFDLEVFNDRLLFLKAQKEPTPGTLGRFYALDLPDLKQTQLASIISGSPESTLVGQTSNGWLVGPAVLDESLKSIKSLHTLSWANLFYALSPEIPGIHNAVGTDVTPPKQRPPRGRNQKEASIPLGDGSITITAKAIDQNKPAANSRRTVQLVVSFTSSDTSWKPVEIPLAMYAQTYDEIALFSAGEGVVVLASRKFYSFFPKDLGVKLPARTPTKMTGLTLRAKKQVNELSARQTTSIPFVAEGGKEPYTFKVAMSGRWGSSSGRGQANQDEVIKIAEKGGTVTLNGSTIVKGLITADPREARDFGDSLYQHFVRESAGATPQEFVDRYIEKVSNKLQPALRKPLQDFAVGVPILVTVTDAASKVISLRHDLVLELPKKEIVELLTQRLANRNRSGQMADQANSLGGLPTPNLPLIWNDGTEIDIANEVRRLWPPAKTDPKVSVVRQAALAAIAKAESLSSDYRQPGQLPVRTWRTSDGKDITGSVVNVRDRYISVLPPNGAEHSEHVTLALLDDESLENAWVDVQKLRRAIGTGIAASYAQSSRIRETHQLGSAMIWFRNQYGCLPPRAIVDKSGKPLLSWRVLVLPYLGQWDLFRLFHLEEPWDSEHNRKLIPYMPLIYNSTQTGIAAGRTTVKVVTGETTAFPESGLRRFYDFSIKPEDIVLIVESDKSKAVEWTNPVDLQVTDDGSWTNELFKIEKGDKKYHLGIFGDSKLWFFRTVDKEWSRQDLSEEELHSTN